MLNNLLKSYINLRILLCLSLALMCVCNAGATHYPDSVQKISSRQEYIPKGWSFEIAGGFAAGGLLYKPWSGGTLDSHISNGIAFPAWNINIGIGYYFTPWMGLATGAHFSTYSAKTSIKGPWVYGKIDQYGDNYTQTIRAEEWLEKQDMYFVEIPLALKFRAIPEYKKVGFLGTLGVKFAMPVYNRFQSKSNSTLYNQVYYPKYDLTIAAVPSVLENGHVPVYEGSIARNNMSALNYVGYMEAGAIFRVHQRIDLSVSLFANYYINDVTTAISRQPFGLSGYLPKGKYSNELHDNTFNGALYTTAVESIHPFSIGLKVGVHFNANRTDAQREYDRACRMPQSEDEWQTGPLPVEINSEDNQDNDNTVDDILAARCEANRREILRLAEECGIDLRELAGPSDQTPVYEVHDTVYIMKIGDNHAKRENAGNSPAASAAEQMEEHLKKAVIYFNIDEAVPLLEPKDILIKIATILKAHPDERIYVNGHTCQLGQPDYNKKLAMRRAQAVAAQLRRLGVSTGQMVVRSMGSDQPFRYNTGKHQLSKDRRVEIVPMSMVNEEDNENKLKEDIKEQTDTTQIINTDPKKETSVETKSETQAVKPAVEKKAPAVEKKIYPKKTTETVREGSRLAQIARRHYGEPKYWVFIYEANRAKLTSPVDIKVGTVLDIPDLNERLKGMSKDEAMKLALKLEVQYLKK